MNKRRWLWVSGRAPDQPWTVQLAVSGDVIDLDCPPDAQLIVDDVFAT